MLFLAQGGVERIVTGYLLKRPVKGINLAGQKKLIKKAGHKS
jgi:hypothetical protein